MRIPFIVGHLTARESQVVVVQHRQPRRFPGPWVMRALVQGSVSSS